MDSLAHIETANVVELAVASVAGERRRRGRPKKPKPTRNPVAKDRFYAIAAALKAIPPDVTGSDRPGRNAIKDKARALISQDRSLSGAALVVGVYLIDQLWWADGFCNRPLVQIARECNLVRSTLTRALKELEAAGHIVRIRQPSAAGDWDHTIYTIPTLEEAWQKVRGGVGSNKSGGRFQQFTPDEGGQVPTNAGGRCKLEPLPSAPPSEGNDHGSARARDPAADAIHSFQKGADPSKPAPEITQEQFEAFRDLADTFGRPAGFIVNQPTPRSVSDPVLGGLVRNELEDYPDEIAAYAIAAALLDATATRLGAIQDGHAGKGWGGLPSLTRFMAKVLAPKADDRVRARDVKEAKNRTERVLQAEVSTRRLSAARHGGRPSRANTDSVMDEAVGGRL